MFRTAEQRITIANRTNMKNSSHSKALEKVKKGIHHKGIHKVGEGAFVHVDGKSPDLHERWKNGKQHISVAKKLNVKHE